MLERNEPLRFYDNDHDPDFTEQRHIDMALERAEYETTTTTSTSKQEICTTKELWWQYPTDSRAQRSQTRGEVTQAPLVLSHEIQAGLRRDRQISGAKRLGTGGVLRVTSLLPTTQTSTDEKSTAQQQNLNVAVSNSSFAHVKKALSKKAAKKPATASLSDLNAMISPRSDFIVVDYKLGNAGFFDWTKVSSKHSSSEKTTSTQRCKTMTTRSSSRSLKNLKSSSSSSQKLPYSSTLFASDHPICPKSSKCELSIRLPNVNFAHKPPSTNQSSRRPPSKEPMKSKTGSHVVDSHACLGQMVFNKCDFQPTLTLSKGFPKALHL